MWRRRMLVLGTLGCFACGSPPAQDPPVLILTEEMGPEMTPDMAPDMAPDVPDLPQEDLDMAPDLLEDEPDLPTPTISIRVRMDPDLAEVALVHHNREVQRCTSDCDIEVVPGDGTLTLKVVNTLAGGSVLGFQGQCVRIDRNDCEMDPFLGGTVTVELLAFEPPTGRAQLLTRLGEGSVNSLAVAADGTRHIVARDVDPSRVPLAGPNGVHYLRMSPQGSVTRALKLPTDMQVLVHPITQEPWFFGRCSSSVRWEGAPGDGSSGLCAARLGDTDDILRGRTWDGFFHDAAIGADGTIGVVASAPDQPELDGQPLPPAGVGFAARVEEAPDGSLRLAALRRVARSHSEISPKIAVGPQGQLHVAGTIFGPQTIHGVEFDIPGFGIQAFLVSFDRAGELIRSRHIESGARSTVSDVLVTGNELHLTGDYNGDFIAPNGPSPPTRGLESYPFMMTYDATTQDSLRYSIGGLYTDIAQLAPAPNGGVYMITDATLGPLSWTSGFAVLEDRGPAIWEVDNRGLVVWMSALGEGWARIAANGPHLVLGGVYEGTLILGESQEMRRRTGYIMGLEAASP